MEFRLLDTGLLSAAENIALDEVLTRRVGAKLSPPTLRFLRFSTDAALLGYHQEASRELRLDYCIKEGIEINRRLTGGGALFFQSSALGWEFIVPLGTSPFLGYFETAVIHICKAAARALSRLGVNASFRPRNDIEVEGRKISGTGGMTLEGGVLFQGTVLIKNEIERFLYALRVPVEKLKKREISSLMQRIVFLEDLLGHYVDWICVKQILIQEFSESLELKLVPGELTSEEREDLKQRLPFFRSEEWLQLRHIPSDYPDWLKSIVQTEAGTMYVHLWLDYRKKRVQRVLISGDFFSRPQNLIMNLEAALMGMRANSSELAKRVLDFLAQTEGELFGISPLLVAQAVSRAAARRELNEYFTPQEAANLFLFWLTPAQLGNLSAAWLLLPYCAKPLDCSWRERSGCGLCGACDLYILYQLAHKRGLTPITIQNYEHFIKVLVQVAASGYSFIGSCCEAFYSKHLSEIEHCRAQGVLVNLDSTTCYDLGKGMEAYFGRYDQQSNLNLSLIEKVVQLMPVRST